MQGKKSWLLILARIPWTRIGIAGIIAVFCFPHWNLDLDPTKPDTDIYGLIHQGFPNHWKELLRMHFPHGPLSWLCHPWPQWPKVMIAFLIQLVLRWGFVIFLLTLIKKGGIIRQLIILFCCVYFLVWAPAEWLWIGNVVLACILWLRTTSSWWMLVIGILTLSAWFIKVSTGTQTLLLLATSCLAYWHVHQLYKKPLILFASYIWSLMIIYFFGGWKINELSEIFRSKMELISGNASAVTLHPLLDTTCIFWIFIPWGLLFIIKSSKSERWIWLLCSILIFASWKHAIARPDPWHLIHFIVAGLLIAMIELSNPLGVRLRSLITILISGSALFTFTSPALAFFEKNPVNVSACWKSFQMCRSATDTPPTSSLEVVVPDAFKSIGVFPWGFHFIQDGKYPDILYKHLKPIPQSYVAYTHWLQQRDSFYWQSPEAPDAVFWLKHQDLFGMQMRSVDTRYQLNDEPNAMIAFLENYHFVEDHTHYALWKKRNAPQQLHEQVTKDSLVKFNTWIPVPKKDQSFLFFSGTIETTWKRKLRSFFYKDYPFALLYKLKDGRILHTVFPPEHLLTGIWINPFIQSGGNHSALEVDSILIYTGSKHLTRTKIQCHWKLLTVNDSIKNSFPINWFENNSKDTLIFAKAAPPHSAIRNALRHPGMSAMDILYQLDPALHSPSAFIQLDSITTPIHVFATTWFYGLTNSRAKLVCQVKKENRVIHYAYQNLEDFQMDYSVPVAASVDWTLPPLPTGCAIEVSVNSGDKFEAYCSPVKMSVMISSLFISD